MSPKKKKPGKPKISYRDLMSKQSASEEKPTANDIDAEKPTVRPPVARKRDEPQRTQRSQRKSKTETAEEKKSPGVEAKETLPVNEAPIPVQSSVPPVFSVVQAVEAVPPVDASGPRDLPPARRRDRSRELTPRELAAVLNEEQMKAAAEKAAADAREAAIENAAPLTLAQLPPVAEPRSSGEGAMSDTMEFAVAAAVATLPFRDRVRARAGIVEVLLFRIGEELFATDLTASEEAIEAPTVHRVPEMPDQMLGFFSLRGKLLPVFSPGQLLGASLSKENGAAVVLRAGEKRIALAIDDVDDVMPLDLARLRDVPAASDPEGVLLGVAWRENELVSLIDAEALLAACQSEQLVETA